MDAIDPHTLHVQQLFVAHHGSLKAFVLALEPRIAEAEDVVQETFLTVTKKASDFEHGSNFFAWVCSIARFKLMQHWRRRPREGVGLSEEALVALEAAAPTPEFFQGRTRLLTRCIEQLARRAKEIVQLRYGQDQRVQDIARRLGWTVNAVSVCLSRARTALRQCVQRQIQTREAT